MRGKILNILSVLLGLLFLNGGLNKFFNYMPVPEDLPQPISRDNEALMEIIWLMPLIASAEILGAILILFPKTRALGALVIFPVMVGILLTHIFVAPEGLVMAILIWAVFLWILYENKQKYFALMQ
ncbi:DoxX family protein [Salegentibacter salinarum]|uniref:DoxX family protein n=1 Tax=Salegentibacter salinarum TaxID=447422 RepID=A0A2N0TVX6_9FLAO|nr:DoxX family membrane protein [Salegentibacter salinarum]PKD18893.1 DoxX family protein [Salegentibacter salinarum]SKB88922.1 DoxX protein [Salegentibacter salinarum]